MRFWYLGEEGFGLDVDEDDWDTGGLRGGVPSVCSCKGVFEIVVTMGNGIGGFREEENGKETAGIGNWEELLHLFSPWVRHVSVVELGCC